MIKLHMKSKGKYNYDATAEYKNGIIVVKKGSLLNPVISKSSKFKFSSKLLKLRNNNDIIENYILKKDIEFSSASKAGIFVCGYSVNGLDRWKTDEGKKLKDIVGETYE